MTLYIDQFTYIAKVDIDMIIAVDWIQGCANLSLYLVVVRFVGEQFWTHVVRCADQSAGHIVLILQDPRDAQIAHFDYVGFGQENILCFQISMQNVLLVQILQIKKKSSSFS